MNVWWGFLCSYFWSHFRLHGVMIQKDNWMKYIIVFLKGGGVLYQYGTNTKFIEIDLVSYYLSIFLKSWSLHCIPQCDMDADFSIVIMIVSELTPVGWLDRPFEWLVLMGFNRWKNVMCELYSSQWRSEFELQCNA